MKKFYKIKEQSLPTDCNRFFISDLNAYFFDLAADLNNAKKLVDHGFVRAATVRKAARTYQDVYRTSNEKLEALYQTGFEFAGHVLNNYWNLKPYLRDKAAQIVGEKFRSHFVIGLQMRNEYLTVPSDIQLFVECALEIEASKRKKEILGDGIKVKWFVASDKEEIVKILIDTYQDRIITGVGSIGHVGHHSGGYERALLDVELLSKCNDTILTGGSTFGFIGALKSQKKPFFIEGMRNQTKCQPLKLFAPARTPNDDAVF